jgi:hypothetical protein
LLPLLDIGCNGGEAQFYLNDKLVGSLSQLQFGHSATFPKAKIVRVSLDKGTNLLLCKVARQGVVPSTPKSFTLRAGLITDPYRKDPSPIREMAPDALLSLPALQQGNTGARCSRERSTMFGISLPPSNTGNSRQEPSTPIPSWASVSG